MLKVPAVLGNPHFGRLSTHHSAPEGLTLSQDVIPYVLRTLPPNVREKVENDLQLPAIPLSAGQGYRLDIQENGGWTLSSSPVGKRFTACA